MKISLPLLLLVLHVSLYAQRPVILGDCTIVYNITGSDFSANNLDGAAEILYIKGKNLRKDITGAHFNQSFIYNNHNDVAVILKEVGSEKYISTITLDEWVQKNSRFKGLNLKLTGDSATILGYNCMEATAILKDGTSYNIYYTISLMLPPNDIPYEFKDVPGLVLKYETSGPNNKTKISYTASQIDFNPVPASKFEIPSSGYRILK